MNTGYSTLIFHGELRDLLHTGKDQRVLHYTVDRRASIKDVIESLGPPHTEVGRISINGREVGFDHILEKNETVEIYPVATPFDVTKAGKLRPEALSGLKFIVDVNVGRLAKYLRIIGYDVLYEQSWRDDTIADKAREEGRIVLSKDRLLLKRSKVKYGRLIRAGEPEKQLEEVAGFFGLTIKQGLFTRCAECNELLEPVPKEAIVHRLEPKTKKYFFRFKRCPSCKRLYWKGSHYERIRKMLDRLDPAGKENTGKQGP